MGQSTYSGRPMACPALVNERTFAQAQAALKLWRRMSGPKPKHTYLLKGKVFCRQCGSLYYVASSSDGKAIYCCGSIRRYGKDAPPHEGKTRWRAAELEETIRQFILRLRSDPENLLAKARVWEERAEGIATERENQETKLRAALDRLEEQRRRVNALCVSQSMTVDEANTEVARIKREKTELETKLSALQQPIEADAYRRMAQILRETAADDRQRHLHEAVDAGLVNYRREIDNLITRIWLEQDGSLAVEGAVGAKLSPRIRSMGWFICW